MAENGAFLSDPERGRGAPPAVLRIMVVDDDPFVRAVTAEALTSGGGAVVMTCASGDEAVAAAQDFQPTLVVLDVHMPGKDGPETWSLLRGRMTTAPRFIFLTADDDPTAREQLLGLGALAVIVKPFDPAFLVGTMHQLMDRTSARVSSARLDSIATEFRVSLAPTIATMESVWSRMAGSDWREQAEIMLTKAHTLAGSAGLFQFSDVGTAADQLECVVGEILKDPQRPTSAELEMVENALAGLQAACRAAVLLKAS